VDTPPTAPSAPTRTELSELSVRLQGEYRPRFKGLSRDVIVGRTRSYMSLGTFIELDGDRYSFPVATRRLGKGWVVSRSVSEVETAMRQFLDRRSQEERGRSDG
jgi:hypothetical protein